MVNSSESKVTRRDAILTSGKVAVALGAAALLGGQLPRVRSLTAGEPEDDDMDEQEQPAGGLATAAVTYQGNDPNDTFFTDVDTPVPHLVDLGLVPVQFVISEVSGSLAGGTPLYELQHRLGHDCWRQHFCTCVVSIIREPRQFSLRHPPGQLSLEPRLMLKLLKTL